MTAYWISCNGAELRPEGSSGEGVDVAGEGSLSDSEPAWARLSIVSEYRVCASSAVEEKTKPGEVQNLSTQTLTAASV